VTDRRVQEGIDPMLWRRADMRAALAARDIAAVFKLLQRVGVSQRRIAALTGQSQSEISEILSGRHVVSYDVLARIADGLGVPRGHLGLAYDDATAALVGLAPTDPATAEPHGEEPADAMTRLTELTVGTATVDPRTWTQPFPVQWGPVPDHIGQSDVARVQAMTDQLRNVDRQHGGGACRHDPIAAISLENLTGAGESDSCEIGRQHAVQRRFARMKMFAHRAIGVEFPESRRLRAGGAECVEHLPGVESEN